MTDKLQTVKHTYKAAASKVFNVLDKTDTTMESNSEIVRKILKELGFKSE